MVPDSEEFKDRYISVIIIEKNYNKKKLNWIRQPTKNVQKIAEKLSIASGEVRSMINYTEQSVKLCSDDEVYEHAQ